MKLDTCSAVRRHLSALCDGELGLTDRAAVQAHLYHCPRCAAEVAEIRAVGDALRVASADRSGPPDILAEAVVSRVVAERHESVGGRLRLLFDDYHVVWAALGATGAAVACVILLVGLFALVPRTRPDSLAALIAAMASPGSNENPVSVDGRMLLPRAYPDGMPDEEILVSEEELVFALSTIVSREGRVTSLELLDAGEWSGHNLSREKRQTILSLMDAIARARFQPARYGSQPVAVNMVWLHAHLTVRGKDPGALRASGRALSMALPRFNEALAA